MPSSSTVTRLQRYATSSGAELDPHRRGLDRGTAGVELGRVVAEDGEVADVAARREARAGSPRRGRPRPAPRARRGSACAAASSGVRPSSACERLVGAAVGDQHDVLHDGTAYARPSPTDPRAVPCARHALVRAVADGRRGSCWPSPASSAELPACRPGPRRAVPATPADPGELTLAGAPRRWPFARGDTDALRDPAEREGPGDPRRARSRRRPCSTSPPRVSQDGGERGLLGLTFSPDGARLYVDYTEQDGDTQVDEYAMRGRRRRRRDPPRTVLDRRAAAAEPQRGPARRSGPTAYLYIGLGDGGAAGDPGRATSPAATGSRSAPCSARSCASTRRRVGRPRTRSRPTTRSSASPAPARRSGRTACATRGASPSTRRPATSGSATSARTRGRRSTTLATDGRNAGRGDNFGWNLCEGTHPLPRRRAPPARSRRCTRYRTTTAACAVIGGFVYRGTQDPRLARRLPLRRLLRRHDPGARCPPGRRRRDHGRDRPVKSSQVSSFGQDNAGRLYVLSLDDRRLPRRSRRRSPRRARSVEHDRAATVHEHPVFDVRAGRPRAQDRDLEVAAATLAGPATESRWLTRTTS